VNKHIITMQSPHNNNNDGNPSWSKRTGLFVSNNAGNKALLMLGSATATLVMNYLLTNHEHHNDDRKESPETKTAEPLKNAARDENVFRFQANRISQLQRDNEELKDQLVAVSEHLETCEAEALIIDQQLETMRHSHNPNGPPSKPNSRHDEPSRPQEVEEDWHRRFYEMDLYNDELLLENSKLVDQLTAANEAYQAVSDQNTELRKIIQKKDADFNERLGEATKAFEHKIQEMQTKLDQAPSELATAQGNSVQKPHKEKEAKSS
jgi:hypothetical protein